ncbi:hypothetical protein ACFU93_35345 [Streptomyces sp. NPDC057611]|uniref:hypothetical protein n=1 Tax=Streptomyces sp. NPDC057611 TaxID=3346182 RepID=UPI00368A0A4C
MLRNVDEIWQHVLDLRTGVRGPADIIRAVDLRPELLPPPVSPERLEELSLEIDRIADLITVCPGDAAEAVQAFNEATGHDYKVLDFAEYWESRDVEEFAMEAARPAHPRVEDITRAELVEIVRRVLAFDPEYAHYLLLLEVNVAHPRVGDLIFHPSDNNLQGASAEEIVDEALRYRPIAL